MPKPDLRVRLFVDFPDTGSLLEFVEMLRSVSENFPKEVSVYHAVVDDIERVPSKKTFVMARESMGRKELKE